MELSEAQKNQIEVFKMELLKRNKVISLFSRKNPNSQLKLLFDQGFLTGKYLSSIFKQAKSPVLDIGSGNGFPGLFMGILYPKAVFYLCERNRKKAEFLKTISSKARIPNIRILYQSAEEINTTFEVILSQAALPVEKMLKLLTKLLSHKGQAFLWKNSSWKEEWPGNKGFIPEVFKSYKAGNTERILLKLTKL